MTENLWLGIDLGTTGVRCVVYNDQLHPVASSYRESPPAYLLDGRVEQDAENWWEGVLDVTSTALDSTDRSCVRGLSISSQGITIVPVDRARGALRPALSWLDSRGDAMLREVAGRIDPATVERRTGKPFRGDYSLAKLAWLGRHEPSSLGAGALVLMPMDYLLWRLTGTAVTDRTMASGSMYYDIRRNDWDDEILAAAGVTRDVLPPVMPAGSLCGVLLPEVAGALGLASDVVVAVGGQDQKCAAYGAGLADDSFTLSLGTAAALAAAQSDPHRRGPAAVFAGLTADTWVREAAVLTAGAALRWLARILGSDDYGELSAIAAPGYPSRGGPMFLPHLSRQDRGSWPTAPRGVFWGLGLDTGRADLVRAVLEGVAFEVGLAASEMIESGGARPQRIRVFGGGARSPLWCQMMADVTGLRVESLDDPEMAAAGAARLARRACGLSDVPEAVASAVYQPISSDLMRAKAERYHRLREAVLDGH